MQAYVDNVERTPVVVLPCIVRWRAPHISEGASVYPACQNLLLAARALGYGGVLSMWHALVEDETTPFFTIDHFRNYNAVLVQQSRLGELERTAAREVAILEGRLEILSENGRGTTVRAQIPCA